MLAPLVAGHILMHTQERFKALFFVHPSTGELYGRILAPLWGPIDRWWGPPTYCRVSPGLALTPLQVCCPCCISLVSLLRVELG